MVKVFLKPSLHKAKSQGSREYTESTLFPILTVEELLPELERHHYLNKIQEIVALPDDHFKVVYENLIDNFVLHVQVLPERYGDELGGLLNDGLRRALLSIQILTETHHTKPHPLLVFAVFSIALLSDIGQLLNYHVMISDQNGVYIDDWHPLLGPMSEFGDYYKIRPAETLQSLVRGVNTILARQLLSETAVIWLSSNDQIFDMWLAFLTKSEDWLGGLGQVLKIDPKQFEIRKGEIGLVPIDIKGHDPLGTELAEQFLAWLKQGLEDGSISYNQRDSLVHVIKTNELDISVFLQSPALFQQFCDVYHKTVTWVVTAGQFNHLGLGPLSGADQTIKKRFSEKPDAKSGKLGFLSREQQNQTKLSAAEKNVLTSAMKTASNQIIDGVIVKDVKTLFGAKVPEISTQVRPVVRNAAVLPKISEADTLRVTQNLAPSK